jgi:hypothetical protein
VPALPADQDPPPRTGTAKAYTGQHIHMDLVGPLPASRGFTHLFTIVNRTSAGPIAALRVMNRLE